MVNMQMGNEMEGSISETLEESDEDDSRGTILGELYDRALKDQRFWPFPNVIRPMY